LTTPVRGQISPSGGVVLERERAPALVEVLDLNAGGERAVVRDRVVDAEVHVAAPGRVVAGRGRARAAAVDGHRRAAPVGLLDLDEPSLLIGIAEHDRRARLLRARSRRQRRERQRRDGQRHPSPARRHTALALHSPFSTRGELFEDSER
jgi:hypothetical protein